jgi:hypothetical protein
MEELFIYVTTKGRYDNCKTVDLIGNYKNLYIIVEPQEYEQYKNKYNDFNILQLPENNKGLAYARNFIKIKSEEDNVKDYWVLDDDISYFYEREGTKLNRIDFETCLNNSKNFFKENNIAVGALEYRQYAWSANKRLIENTFCDSAVYIDNTLTKGLRYNQDLKLKVDRDFCIKTIKSGNKTGRDTFYAFSVPPNGSNKGGLKEIAYDVNGIERDMCLKMVELWGDNICQHIVKPDGRNDLKIHWANINTNQTTLF